MVALVTSHAGEDSLELFEGSFDFDRQQGAPGVNHPVVLQRRTLHGWPAVAERLAKQALGAVPLHGVADSLTRSRDAEPVMIQAVRVNEGSHQRTIVTLTLRINPAKFVRGTQF